MNRIAKSIISSIALLGLLFLGLIFALFIKNFTMSLKPMPTKPQVKITIPEGFTVLEIDERLAGAGIIKQGELEQFIKEKKLEGYLFPDTYFFHRDGSLEEITQKMRDNFDRKVTPEISKEMIIMASILEKEVPDSGDRKVVAGILWKRLKVGMALQVDAAPITYKEPGLPAEPISNPGLDAINAAFNPTVTDYWYYLSKPDKTTIFSRGLEEHNLAKSKYLK